jgi:uncharacterized integral membrane protein
MRQNTQDEPLRPAVQRGSRRKFSVRLASLHAHWRAHGRPALGLLFVVLLVVLASQNAGAVNVKFLVWQANISQALVVVLALLSGAVIGAALARRRQRRSPRDEA